MLRWYCGAVLRDLKAAEAWIANAGLFICDRRTAS